MADRDSRMILGDHVGDAHARDTRSTGIVGMNAWSNAIAGDVNADVVADVIADDIAVRGRFLSSVYSIGHVTVHI